MKTALIVVVAFIATVVLADWAYGAEDRIPTEAKILVMPGNHVFKNREPIKVCFGAYTDVDTDVPVKVAVDIKGDGGQGWDTIRDMELHVNKVRCWIGTLLTDNGQDFWLRTRVIQSPTFARSEQRLRVEVYP